MLEPARLLLTVVAAVTTSRAPAPVPVAPPVAQMADELPPAFSAAVVVKAVQSCLGAVSLSGVNGAKLRTDGWAPATDEKGNPKPSGTVDFYERDNVVAIATAPQGDSRGACTLIARLPDQAVAGELADAIDQALAVKPTKAENNNGEIYWVLPNQKFVDLSAAGSTSKPSVRITIAQQAGEKK